MYEEKVVLVDDFDEDEYWTDEECDRRAVDVLNGDGYYDGSGMYRSYGGI